MLDWLIAKLCHPDRVGWGNCYLSVLLYARHGGNLIITKSAGHPLIPHIAWTGELPPTKVLHFVPLDRKKGWSAIVHSPIFKGRWKYQVIQGGRAADAATMDSGRGRR